MHAEPRNAVPFGVITPNECVFSAGNFPHPLDRKKPAGDFLSIDPLPVFDLSQMLIQSATKFLSLPNIYGRTTAKKNIYTRLARGIGRR